MTRRTRSKSPSAGRGRFTKIVAIWGAIGLGGAGLAAAAIRQATSPADPVALCESGKSTAASTVVLVDTTDALTAMQQRRLRATVESERDRLPRGGKLTIVTINPASPAEPAEMVSACNPGSAADANPLFQTASRTQKRWADLFGEPVEAAIAKASLGSPSAASPIIETVAATLTRPDFDARVQDRRLVIISDLLEHQRGIYSQLGGGELWASYLASPLRRRVALDLRGVAVAIDYLARPAFAAVQGEAHRAFWRRLFVEAGASEVAFIGLLPPPAAQDTASAVPEGPPPPRPATKASRPIKPPKGHKP